MESNLSSSDVAHQFICTTKTPDSDKQNILSNTHSSNLTLNSEPQSLSLDSEYHTSTDKISPNPILTNSSVSPKRPIGSESQYFNMKNSPIRTTKTAQEDLSSKHARSRSFGTSLLDVMNDRAVHNVDIPIMGISALSIDQATNERLSFSSFNRLHPETLPVLSHSENYSISELQPSPPKNINNSSQGDSNAQFFEDNGHVSSSSTKISNEAIFGFPPGLKPSQQSPNDKVNGNKSSSGINAPPGLLIDNLGSQSSTSSLLRGTLSGNAYKSAFSKRHGGSASVSFGKAKSIFSNNTNISSDILNDNYWNAANQPLLSQSNINASHDILRLYKSRESKESHNVPPIPDLVSLGLKNSSKNPEIASGSNVSRGVSVPDTWTSTKKAENIFQQYTFGSPASKNENISENMVNQQHPHLKLIPSMNNIDFNENQRSHARSKTLGNSLGTISSDFYESSTFNNNELNEYITKMNSTNRPSLGSLIADYNSNDYYIPYGSAEDNILGTNHELQMSESRHIRQGSLDLLGIRRQIDLNNLGQSYSSMTNLAMLNRIEDESPLVGMSRFSAIGRSGTTGLLQGIKTSSSHHASSISVSGTIGVSTEIAPTRSLWVGNLDLNITAQELIEVFGKFGRIESLRTLPDKECAFVNFMRLEDAMAAHDEMQGRKIKNSSVRVGYGKGEGYASSDAQAMQPTRALWIGNISSTTTPASLRKVFEKFGVVESARILTQKSCGFVNFERLEDAVRAKQATNGRELDGMVVRIGYAKVPVRGSEGFTRPRNQVPTAPPLTVSGRIAEANAIVGTSTGGLGSEDVLEPGVPVMDESLVAFPYASSLPQLPPNTSQLILGQTRLRELRKRLDSQCNQSEFDAIFNETIPYIVDLCTDYVGNMLVQRLAERGSYDQKMQIAKLVSPHIASIGVHKNGTWAVQKIIDCVTEKEIQQVIIEGVRPYVPQLLLDQLGNYVVQCCLSFPENRNQFIFDAIHARSWDIAQGRFGARAIRTCLENSNTTRAQQKLVAVVLVLNAVSLSTNANGNILITWLLDSSNFPGRFRVISPQLAGHLRHLCTHKLGSATILKIIDQREEPDARDLILNTLFFNPEPQVLDDILADQVHGANVVLRVLLSSSVDDNEKTKIASHIQSSLVMLQHQGVQGYHKLFDVVDQILKNNPNASSYSNSNSDMNSGVMLNGGFNSIGSTNNILAPINEYLTENSTIEAGNVSHPSFIGQSSINNNSLFPASGPLVGQGISTQNSHMSLSSSPGNNAQYQHLMQQQQNEYTSSGTLSNSGVGTSITGQQMMFQQNPYMQNEVYNNNSVVNSQTISFIQNGTTDIVSSSNIPQ
ncbi:hypothetical protein BB559_001384 [Furculomyces boomerangus]|uniref:PUM-HD domain-containing protein n=2 Tax=Harpellales TaxID=61421 RepID=A0A2T9Z251_9FUNG|nr:hypothetical protein BB559_001384 [Furculomyces boomerangus]PVZ98534.1 hypothetical protein BB558_005447 [Smittium angustum]